MLPSLIESTAVLQDQDAPFQFLSGWIYGVSFQKDDIRDAMIACREQDKELTNDMYLGFKAVEQNDMATASKYFKSAQDKFPAALKKCDKTVTDPLDAWKKNMDTMTGKCDWDKTEKQIYSDNKDEIDGDMKLEMKWWDSEVHFSAGMYAGRIDKIFWDASNKSTEEPIAFFHPFA